MKKALVLLAFLGISLFWFWREAFQGYLFCFSDLTFYFYPYRFVMAEVVKAGHIPLWNPHISMGFPFLAVLQPGVFYPFSLLYYVFPFDRAFSWFLILHFPLAAFFMYLFCRELKISTFASFGSGLVYAFSGYTLSVLHMPTTLSSIIWLPLVFLFYRRALRDSRYTLLVTNVALTGIFLACMFLGGEPTILYGTGWLLIGYLVASRFGRWREVGKGISILLLSGITAILISAVQLFPFVELLMHSARAGGISFREASYFSFQPRKLIGFIFPYFFHVTALPWVERDWTKFPYLGMVPAYLSLFALFLHKDRRIFWLGAGIVLVLFILIGSYSPIPVYFLLYKFIPGFNLFRYPIKFTFILVFIVSLLCGLGSDLLWEETPRMKRTIMVLFALLVPLFCVFAWGYLNQQAVFTVLRPLFSEEISLGWEKYVRAISVPRDIANFGIILLFLLAINLWLIASCYRKVRKEYFTAGLAFLVFLDLFTANIGANFSIKEDDYKVGSENITLLKKDRSVFRYFASPEIYKRSHQETGSEFYNYKKALISIRDRLTSNQNMLYGLADIDGYESIRGAEQDRVINRIYTLDSLRGISILDLLNVKYLIAPGEFFQPGYELVSRRREMIKRGEIYLYRNRNVLPRAFLAPKAKIMKDRQKILDHIFSPQFKPREEIILEEDVPGAGGYWFVSEWFYPGWKAYVDGREARIYRANYMFRAVPLPPGKHEVEFVYDPLSFKLGAIVSSLA
ncbi:MAG: YfhO family protein, partial [Candidatus Margulisbacteria bacterium]|nr:YfhO family protein [Candidatus Margulisiibacteriota bacterium]